MNRWIRRAVSSASFATLLAVLPAGVAFADASDASRHKGHHFEHHHRESLVGTALKLDSLTAEQRSSIEQLNQARRDARVPVRQADASVLLQLAQQVEQASIDPKTLDPTLKTEESAAMAESAIDRDTLTKLHALLTPDQRNQVVTMTEAGHGHKRSHEAKEQGERREHGERGAKLGLTVEQKKEIRANLQGEHGANSGRRGERRAALEAFRGDSFDATALVHVRVAGERAMKLAHAMVPVLTPAQRATFASELRARAAHERG